MTPKRDDLGPSPLPAHLQRRRRTDSPTAIRWNVVVQIVTWVVALFSLYVMNSNRLTALETKGGEDSRRIERIEQKLDRALERWASGGVR